MEESKKPSFGKAFFTCLLLAVVILVILIAINIGLGIGGIPFWPFIMFLFWFCSVDGLNKEKLWPSAIGGLLGIITGFSATLLIELTGNATLGLVVMIALITVLLALNVMGIIPVINAFTMLIITLITSFGIPAGSWAGLSMDNPAYAEMTMGVAFLRILISYAISVVLFWIITSIAAGSAKKKALVAEKAGKTA